MRTQTHDGYYFFALFKIDPSHVAMSVIHDMTE